MIVEAVPYLLRKSMSPGIGLFIAFIGLQSSGIVCHSDSTLVTLGNLHDPAVVLAIIGILLTSILLVKNVTGALLVSMQEAVQA